ncbi:MAG: protein kinase [Chloroflexota bacterium]|nr:protein kinase [Chloroflexota bacterium]
MAQFTNQKLGGRYEVRERIGAGGMARVFRGWDTNLDRAVAIKILHEHLVEDPSFKDRFTREAKLVASLNHPNIVQVYDYSFFERDGVPVYYMVMPLIKGRTLRALLDNYARQGERLQAEQTIRIVRELCSALGYAHERGMVHRDIKPGNVIMDENGRAILTDFGISRMVGVTRITQESVTTGTPAYMSPEQASGETGDARSDLYSLGVMLFEMWTGKLPYTDDGTLSILIKHLSAPIPTISEVLDTPDPEMDTLIKRILAKAPEDRFQSASELATALKQIGKPLDEDTLLLNFAGSPGAPSGTSLPLTPTMPPNARDAVGQTTIVLNLRFQRWFAILGVALLVIIVLALLPRLGLPPGVSSVTTPDTAQTTLVVTPLETNQQGFTASFDTNDPDITRFPESGDDGVQRIFDLESGFYRLINPQTGTAKTTLLVSDLPYGMVTISMVARLMPGSSPTAAYGIVFRYQDEDNYNVFAVDGEGRYSIWVRRGGEWIELRSQTERWTLNENVNPLGEPNRLRININEAGFTLFINNQPIDLDNDPTTPNIVEDNTFSTGALGIYLASPEDAIGLADVEIDMYEVYPIIPAMTETTRQN